MTERAFDIPPFFSTSDNLAYRLEWGIDPSHARRRRRLNFFVWLPSILYVLFVVLFLALAHDSDSMVGAPFAAAALTTTCYLFYLALRRDPLVMRSENRAAMLMTGLQGRVMLIGAAHPLIPALGFVIGLHYLFSLTIVMFAEPIGSFHSLEAMFIIFLYSTPVVALLLGATMAPSLWVMVRSWAVRVLILALWVFAWLVSYWIIFFVIGWTFAEGFHFSGYYDFLPFYFLFVLGLSAIVPGYVNYVLFRKSMRKLETIK